MCDVGTLLSVAGTGASVIGKLQEGILGGIGNDLQGRVFRANAQILDKQAEVAELGADMAFTRARVNEARVRDAGEDTLAAQRTWYASNYLDPAYGSPLIHQAMTAGQLEHDVELIRVTAQLEAADAITRGANIRTQAASQSMAGVLSEFKGNAARMAGMIGAGTALISGAARIKGGGSGAGLGNSSIGDATAIGAWY